ncbi:DUF6090 family protein [Fulvivirga sedimenti]|uniref:Uncharacterized protein n=1 Tax=Fulvivirga sedimenti TaxID=2879465 RepID=A0A9X1HRA8_9BACT|nr:DUF6090 family protein [Fulvivirga sedimenti]MCA6075064.1 hypothetical protein [Fulvivirga sedimenti]MCA6076241.1 hypothetical protein [Fulvivirga sedimenti]MCA6077369.1 hypothetical protein [Fulvivirga sedimenti]
MIKLFSQIRKQLVSQNSIRKYLLYALGEIFLVMIGILMALQVNTWNDERKSRKTEINIYEEIQDDLSASLRDLMSGLATHNERLDMTTKLRDHLIKKNPLTDSLVDYLRNTNNDDQFFPKTSGFEALKSVGLRTLRNDTLRENITNLYQLGFERVVGLGRDKAPIRNFEFMTPFADKYSQVTDGSGYYLPNFQNDSIFIYPTMIHNYEEMLKDDLLILKLQEAIWLRIFKIRNYTRIIRWTNGLNSQIEQELDRLRNAD